MTWPEAFEKSIDTICTFLLLVIVAIGLFGNPFRKVK